MTSIRYAQIKDLDLIGKYDIHVERSILEKLIIDRHVMIFEKDGVFLGWLRYNLFWDKIPFMNMLFFLDEYRGKGYGTKLALDWEKEMKLLGYDVVMTSTQANESSQHFYRKLKYEDVGSFMPPNEPLELILVKKI